ALRSRFQMKSGNVIQSIAEGEDIDRVVHEVDISDISASQIPIHLREAATRWQASLDLETGPLIRVILFRTAKSSDRLLIVVHHLVVDGVSWRILLADFVAIYGQLSDKATVVLPPKTVSVQHWAKGLIH